MTEIVEAIFTGEIHAYADRWPMRTADEIEAMAASITTNGQRFPIVLTPGGVLIDGRNRLRACEVAGVPPLFEVRAELDTDDAVVAFIWDANGDRRDMSKGAKAMLAALRPGSVRLLSNHQGLSHAYVVKARQVIEFCSEEIIDAVIKDDKEWPLNRAYEVAQEIKATVQAEEIAARKAAAEAKKEAERQAQLLATLTDKAPDLAALVNDGMPLKEALAACDARFEKDRREAALLAEKTAKLNRDVNAQVYLFAAFGEYPERLAELVDLWSPEHQPYPVTEETIRHAIAGLEAILNLVRSTA